MSTNGLSVRICPQTLKTMRTLGQAEPQKGSHLAGELKSDTFPARLGFLAGVGGRRARLCRRSSAPLSVSAGRARDARAQARARRRNASRRRTVQRQEVHPHRQSTAIRHDPLSTRIRVHRLCHCHSAPLATICLQAVHRAPGRTASIEPKTLRISVYQQFTVSP